MACMHGNLSSKKLFSWKERFWVLSGVNLACYSQEGETIPLELYKITEDFSLERSCNGACRQVKGKENGSCKGRKKKHGFVLRGPGKVKIHLRCTSAKVEAEWMNVLQRTIKQEVQT